MYPPLQFKGNGHRESLFVYGYEPAWFCNLAGDLCVLLFFTPGENFGGLHGEMTQSQGKPSQLLPTFCNRREPEYLVTMEYSSPPKASAQDFTLKRGKNENQCWPFEVSRTAYFLRQGKLHLP